MCRVTQRTYIHGTLLLVRERLERSGCFSYYLEVSGMGCTSTAPIVPRQRRVRNILTRDDLPRIRPE